MHGARSQFPTDQTTVLSQTSTPAPRQPQRHRHQAHHHPSPNTLPHQAHGTSTGGCKAQPVRPQVPTPIASGTLLRFGDKNAPLFLVKYCTKQDLLGSALHRQATHQQHQLPFTPTSPHPQPGSPPSRAGSSSAQPLEEQHPNPQQPQHDAQLSSAHDSEPPPPGAPSPKAPEVDDGMEQADDEEFTDPLTPHTMINTQLNAVLPVRMNAHDRRASTNTNTNTTLAALLRPHGPPTHLPTH